MRPGSRLASSLLLFACTPPEQPAGTDSGSSTGSSSGAEPTTGDSASTTSGAASGSTGPAGECVPPPGEQLDVLILAGDIVVVRPGNMTCGEANPNSCDCASEAIDRLVLEIGEPIDPAAYEFLANQPGVTHTECAKGDDGCSQTGRDGWISFETVSPTCITGTIDFPGVAVGSFAADPC